MRTFLRLAPAAATLAAAGCATMANGTVQRIPVTSDPPGARVLLDGRSAGFTPTQVMVSRRNREPVVEIEMSGFRPAVHRLERRENWEPVLWDVALGVAVISVAGRLMLQHDEASLGFGQTIGVFALGAVPGIVDYSNGAAFRFRRNRIDAVLSALRQSRAQVPMRPVQPNGHGLLRDSKLLGDPRVRPFFEVPQLHDLSGGCQRCGRCALRSSRGD